MLGNLFFKDAKILQDKNAYSLTFGNSHCSLKHVTFIVALSISGWLYFQISNHLTFNGIMYNKTGLRCLASKAQFSWLRWWENKGINQTLDLPQHLASFQNWLPLEEQRMMRKLFFKVTQLFQENNITYYLADGSLIGAYRHLGIIPWDDDIDLYVSVTDNDTIRKLFHDDNPVMIDNFQLTFERFRFHFSKVLISYVLKNNSRSKPETRWPAVDVFFYEDKIDHLHNGKVESDKIFPLQKHLFEGTLQPVPRNIAYYIRQVNQGNVLNECCSKQRHRHKYDSGMKFVCIPCSELYPYYPFAIRMQGVQVIRLGNERLVPEINEQKEAKRNILEQVVCLLQNGE